MVTYDRLTKDGVEGGMAPELVAKIGDLVEAEGPMVYSPLSPHG